jgi:hypothetical protein
MTFHHQIVFDPRSNSVVNLMPVELEMIPTCIRHFYAGNLQDLENEKKRVISFPFLGCYIPEEVAQAVASGKMDPITKVSAILLCFSAVL